MTVFVVSPQYGSPHFQITLDGDAPHRDLLVNLDFRYRPASRSMAGFWQWSSFVDQDSDATPHAVTARRTLDMWRKLEAAGLEASGSLQQLQAWAHMEIALGRAEA